jgi:hypothetical protein
MIEKIRENINNPEELERLYQEDKRSFESGFEKIYPMIENNELAKFWKIRLDVEKRSGKAKGFSLTDVFILVVVCIMTGFLIRIPGIFRIDMTDFIFYEKNAGIIVFLGLSIYTIWINKILEVKKLLIVFLAFLIPAIFINLLPSDIKRDTVNLVYLHLPLLMWCIYGLVFTDFDLKDRNRRIGYIRYNGDLAVLLALLLTAGGLLTGITIGLFNVINIKIDKFYTDNVVMVGLVSAPIVAAYIIKNYTTLTNKIAPLIAKIFSPLVLVTLIIYLVAILYSGKNPYNDRNFLLIFNIMLLGVMGIIVFSISETSINRKQRFNELVLFILSMITIIIDLVALSAIFYRLGEFGLSPNRLAVLGSNILIFGNLVLIMMDLFKINFKKSEIAKVELTISKYLPIYIIWIVFVIFGFPLIFGIK